MADLRSESLSVMYWRLHTVCEALRVAIVSEHSRNLNSRSHATPPIRKALRNDSADCIRVSKTRGAHQAH